MQDGGIVVTLISRWHKGCKDFHILFECCFKLSGIGVYFFDFYVTAYVSVPWESDLALDYL